MAKILWASVLVLATGCGTSVERTNSPSGAPGYLIECGSDRQACLAEAGNQCGSAGYTVVSEDWHRGAFWKRVYTMNVECGGGGDTADVEQVD